MTNDIDCKQVLRVDSFYFCVFFYCRYLARQTNKDKRLSIFKISAISSLIFPIKENVYFEFVN